MNRRVDLEAHQTAQLGEAGLASLQGLCSTICEASSSFASYVSSAAQLGNSRITRLVFSPAPVYCASCTWEIICLRRTSSSKTGSAMSVSALLYAAALPGSA